jgi:DNA polymerase IV
MSRKILHLDLDAFFCAVEEQRDPRLSGRAFAVGGRPDQRGVVASCSYAARLSGIHSAMPMARALKLCPSLIIVGGRHAEYSQVSRQVMERLWALTDQVEKVSIDEAFLEATDLPQSGEELARLLQARIRNELGLPCSLGVATNKLVAKIANDVGKAGTKKSGPPGPPNAITIVPPGLEAEFLAPLPARALWGVGPKTEEQLGKMGITTIGELAHWPEADLTQRFGKHGKELSIKARGIDDSPIITSHTAKSFSQETTFARDIRNREALQKTLSDLAEGVAMQLQKAGMSCHTVKIKLRWSDFTTITRQHTLENSTDKHSIIYQTSLALFEKAWAANRPVRLLGVGATGLGSQSTGGLAYRQLQLWEGDLSKDRRLQETITSLRERFGDQAVQFGRGLDQEKKE